MTVDLSRLRILVVEDEFFLACELEDVLVEAGASVVGPVGDLATAMERVREGGFNLAVVDINLRGELAYPLADLLTRQGIDFVFATAYVPSAIPPRFSGRPLLEKPFGKKKILSTLLSFAVRPAV